MIDIKILKNNYKKENTTNENIKVLEPYPRKLICENCESELEYEESDLVMGEYGCMFVDCPICGEHNMLDDNEHSITLTVDNIEFPVHFHHISKETGAKDIFTNEEIKPYIRKAICYFRENKEEYDWGGWITSNLYIHVHKYSGDENYTVYVSNEFYKVEIPFEKEDY